jgi:hypothetical protein
MFEFQAGNFLLNHFRGNATLCVFPIAIADDGRRRDKMFNAEYLANIILFLQSFLTGIFWA